MKKVKLLNLNYIWFSRYLPSRNTRFLIVALMVSIIVGFISIFIRYLIAEFQYIYFGVDGDLYTHLRSLPWYMRVFSPCLGGLLVGILSNSIFQDCSGDGVEKVMIAVSKESGNLSLFGVIGRMFNSAITVGSGGSTGREGPIVHIAGGIASFIGRIFRFNPEYVKLMVGVGVASGIAAGFNAPIAGTFFAVEILLRDFTLQTFMPVILSAVTATVIAGFFSPDEYKIPFEDILKNYSLGHPFELFLFFILGVFTAFCSYTFVRNLISSEVFFSRLPIPKFLKPAIGGLAVGIIGYWVPEIMGLGYTAMHNIIISEGQSQDFFDLSSPWFMLFVILIFKIISTGLTLSSGGSGGTLIPSLFLGCVLGKILGVIFPIFLSEYIIINPKAYAMVGMAGVLAGTTQAPIMTIMLFFEFTNNYQIVFPVIIVSFTSAWLSYYILGASIYTVKLKKLGVNLQDNLEKTLMSRISVSEIMQSNSIRINENETVAKVFNLLSQVGDHLIFVTNENLEFKGIIGFNQLRNLMGYPQEEWLKYYVKDYMDKNYSFVIPTDTLSLCMKIFSSQESGHAGILPVFNSAENRILIGYVDQKQVWNIYNLEVGKRSESMVRFDSLIDGISYRRYLDFSSNYRFEIVQVPREFVGKNLFSLNIRKNYNIMIIAIQRSNRMKHEIVHPKTVFKEGDYIVITGENEAINTFLN